MTVALRAKEHRADLLVEAQSVAGAGQRIGACRVVDARAVVPELGGACDDTAVEIDDASRGE